ncbi:MAG: endolytic transglycosylase MltG, partial [Thermoleophilaceae bacterium]
RVDGRRSLPPRRSAAERRAAAKEYLHGRRPAGRGAGPARPGRARRPRSRWALAAAVAGALVVAFAAWFAVSLFQPFKGEGTGEVTVTIPDGATVGEIADILERRGVISSAFFFRTRAKLSGRTGDLKAARNVPMRRDMSYVAAMDALADPPPPDVVTITIPEGLSRAEARQMVPDALRGDYVRATRRSRALDPRDYGARGADSLEGFLFPATYELKPGRPVTQLVTRQLTAFEDAFEQVDMRFARRRNLTPYDVLIIASMVEREVSVPRERRLVASVIYNRLSQSIPLGIDATIRFATGNWSEPLKESELAIDSPYNTRTNQGLPPGPIGNPGLAAMKAAAHPASTDYIYYVVKPCGEGEHAFSETDAEFQEDVARYNAERDRQGGRSPTEC